MMTSSPVESQVPTATLASVLSTFLVPMGGERANSMSQSFKRLLHAMGKLKFLRTLHFVPKDSLLLSPQDPVGDRSNTTLVLLILVKEFYSLLTTSLLFMIGLRVLFLLTGISSSFSSIFIKLDSLAFSSEFDVNNLDSFESSNFSLDDQLESVFGSIRSAIIII